MKAISHFLRTTILGGVLFLAPIVVLLFVLSKAFEIARRGLKPVAAIIPDRLVSGTATEAILAIVLIALLCFLAGLFARTRPAQQIVAELESTVLSKIPAYEYLKQAGTSVMGLGEMADHPVVLAQLGDAWRIGVQTQLVRRRRCRGVHSQFPEPHVWIGFPPRRRSCPSGLRSARRGDRLPEAVRRRVGHGPERARAQHGDGLTPTCRSEDDLARDSRCGSSLTAKPDWSETFRDRAGRQFAGPVSRD